MRLLHSLTALVLAASTTLTVAPREADACGGGYAAFSLQEPRPHRVVAHLRYDGTTWNILLPEKGTGVKTFTLVGPSGARIVSTANVAKETSDDFRFALEGVNTDAQWVELADVGFSVKQQRTFVERFDLVRGKSTFATYEGRPLGAVTVGGWRTYLIVHSRRTATTTAYLIS